VTRRWRTPRYGTSIGIALVGVICGATIPGTLGGTLATALIGIGMVGIVSLIFYEVGLSEDRDRSRRRGRVAPPAPEQADQTAQPGGAQDRSAPPNDAHDRSAQPDGEQDRRARPRGLARRRGERRRLG
jgi:hypothetical protein